MNKFDFVAILGALAWMPHLIDLVRNWVTRPEVQVMTTRTAQIGFTVFGPILNINFAFAVKNRDLVVSGLRIKLRHENGDERLFEWQGIRQTISKMTNENGSVLSQEKEQSVLAIKLSQKDIEERLVQCQEPVFVRGKYDKESIVARKISSLRDQNAYDPVRFLSGEEMRDLIKYVAHSFQWKSGTYSLTVEMDSPEKFNIVGNRHKFSLTSMDIEELEKNKGHLMLYYKNELVPQSKEDVKQCQWNWRNPILEKIDG